MADSRHRLGIEIRPRRTVLAVALDEPARAGPVAVGVRIERIPIVQVDAEEQPVIAEIGGIAESGQVDPQLRRVARVDVDAGRVEGGAGLELERDLRLALRDQGREMIRGLSNASVPDPESDPSRLEAAV